MDFTKEQLARIWLQCAPMNAWNKLLKLKEKLGGAEQVWDHFTPEYYTLLGEEAFSLLADARANRCAKALGQMAALGANPLFFGAADYPLPLSRISHAPDVLFCQGALPADGMPAIAIVGSRSATRYGLAHAKRIARELAAQGIAVISGLARGIDAAAHEGALEGGGCTVAVLGSGLGDLYPAENKALAARILQSGGAIVSELAPDAPPLPYHFPVRNRIISGLADGVLLIEAKLKSGTHTTINYALDQGREVFALPGNVDAPGSELPLTLLKEGAKICTCGRDIIETMGWEKATPQQASFLPQEEEETADPILKALALEEKTLEELIRETGLPAGELGTQLTLLEISGKIERRAGRAYALRR
ncbi:MAG: DNA-processing protein DprA [Clostridia bacterium]|nr:DNA-processing protein DprA [Clostridia bacterium]